MPHLPDRSRFAALARSSRLVPVYRRLFADALTPLSAFARIDAGDAGCLFESVVGGEKVGRYSFLTADPFLRLEARGDRVRVIAADGTVEEFTSRDPLADLEQRMAAYRPARLPELPPFTSGAIGYAAYDAVRYVERLPNPPADDLGLPDLSFAFYDRMVVFDNVTKAIDVVVLARIEDESAAGLSAAYDAACRRIDATIDRLFTPSAWPPPADIGPRGDPACLRDGTAASRFDREGFLAAVDQAIEYIRAGDIFQVVLSRRLEIPFAAPAIELYRTLRVVNPSPFMFFLRTPACTLVGSSPEIMVRCVDGAVTVRPLAGTRRRGGTPEEDGGDRVGGAVRRDDDRALQPRHAPHEQRHGAADPRPHGLRRPAGVPARRHRVGCAQDPGHGDHRPARAGAARPLCRRRRLRRLRRLDGHLHRAADDRRGRREGLRAVGGGNRRRQRSGEGVRGDGQQGQGAARVHRDDGRAAGGPVHRAGRERVSG